MRVHASLLEHILIAMMKARLLIVILTIAGGILTKFDGLDDAAKALRDAVTRDNADGQKSSTQQIVDLGDARGVPVLNNVLMDAIPTLRKTETELETLESQYEQKKDKIERQKASPDEQTKNEGRKAEIELKEFVDKKLGPARKRAGALRATREIVSKGLADLTSKLPADKRKSETDRLAKTVLDATKIWDDRVAAMECYARMGDPGCFSNIWKVSKDSQKERKKLLTELPEKESAFEKERARFWDQVKKGNGTVYKGADEVMKKLEGEVKALQEKIYTQTQLVEATARLVPVSIISLPASAQTKPIAELTGAAKGNDPQAKLTAIEVLGGIPDANIRTFLRTLIVGGDPGARVAAIDAIMKQKDDGAIDIILEKCIKDEEWSVRAAAIASLVTLRSAKSIPALLAALENEVGRLRDDAQDALENLSGVTNISSVAAWKQWWEKSQSGFNPAPPSSQPAKKGPRAGDTGVAFAGIKSSSKNVAYVVDVSGSMKFGLENDAAPPDGKPTRFAMLKKELEASIENLPEGGKFVLLTFSTGVTQFTPQPQAVNKDTRKKVLDYVRNEMTPDGGTNIYAALKAAFDVAGMGATDKFYRPAIDTIFFLTDGTPSPDTEITDPERLLAYVRERNKLGKIAVHVVCLGEADANFLRKLASQNNGEFTKP